MGATVMVAQVAVEDKVQAKVAALAVALAEAKVRVLLAQVAEGAARQAWAAVVVAVPAS